MAIGAGFSVCGTAFSAPRLGAVDILENALISVDAGGDIRSVRLPSDAGYASEKSEAARAGRLVRLGDGQFLLPGLVDLHIHAPQWPQAGKALDLPLADWLRQHTFPLEARYADLAFARRMYASLVDALLANGTTTAVYFATIHHEASLALADICLSRGQRALVGRVAMDHSAECPEWYRDPSAEAAIDGTRAFVEAVRTLSGNGSGLVRPIVTPRFVPACTDRLLEGLGALARECACHVQTHCSESDWEHAHVLTRTGTTDARALDAFGLVARGTILAHGNFIAGGDLDLIGRAGAGIAHCPLSNLYFANSVLPVRDALRHGLPVGLGTDVAAGHSPSVFEACRHAVAASRALEDGVDPARPPGERGRGASRIDHREAFWLATAGGGEALNLKVGRLEAGYSFDAVLLDVNAPGSNVRVWDDLDGLDDVFQKIVFGASALNVRRAWVQGRLVHDLSRPPHSPRSAWMTGCR
jgi:guanine deaminase